MEFFRIHKTIPFMRHAVVLNIVSVVTFVLAVFFLFHRGLHLSVEFTGGTVMEVAYTQSGDVGKVREIETEGSLRYTDEGQLIGHLVLVLDWTRKDRHFAVADSLFLSERQ